MFQPTKKTFTPTTPDESSHQSPFLIIGHLHDVGLLKPLPDPVLLLQVVQKHILRSNVLAVDLLQKVVYRVC